MQILDCLDSLASNHSATDNKHFLTDLCLAEKHILCCHVSALIQSRNREDQRSRTGCKDDGIGMQFLKSIGILQFVLNGGGLK